MAREIADSRRQKVWAVGGVVRDLLDERPSGDVDLAVLGDSIAYAKALAVRVGGAPRIEPRFLTAAFTSRSGIAIDIVRARCETYARRASLPIVRPGTLLEDLFRRDFSVNAMAVPVGSDPGDLVDPFGGRMDLDRRILRVLHERSFFDDPTRLLRGVRLAARLDLAWEESTARQAACAVAEGVFDNLSRDRLRSEVRLLLSDPKLTRGALVPMADLGLTDVLFPRPVIAATVGPRLERLGALAGSLRRIGSPWIATLAALTWDLADEERAIVAARLGLSGGVAREVVSLPAAARRLGRALETLDSPHERFRMGKDLGRFGRSVAACCAAPAVREFLVGEWRLLESRQLRISGRDLVALGFATGPAIGDALAATHRMRLDGTIGEDEELEFAARYLGGSGDTADPRDRVDRCKMSDPRTGGCRRR